MLVREPFSFKPAQEARFRQDYGRLPTPGERHVLEGPVCIVNVRGPGLPNPIHDVAMIDSGADVSMGCLGWLARQSSGQHAPAFTLGRSSVALNGYEFDVNGTQLNSSQPTEFRTTLPGFENLIIGRSHLESVVFCCAGRVFSLVPAQNVTARCLAAVGAP